MIATLAAASMVFAPGPGVDAMLPFARNVWPGSPCAGRERIELAVLPEDRDGEAYVDTCTIRLREDLTGSDLCTVLVHELGHLAGLGHSANPRSVMATPPPEPWRPCWDRWGDPRLVAQVASGERRCRWVRTTRKGTSVWRCGAVQMMVSKRGRVL